MISYILSLLEDDASTASLTAQQISSKVDLLTAAQLVADSWRGITCRTIKNCFIHSGIIKRREQDEQPDAPSEDKFTASLVQNYDDFVRIDDSIQCYSEEHGDSVDEVVEIIIGAEREESSGNDVPTYEPRESKEQALNLVSRLQKYLMHGGEDLLVEVLRSLHICFYYRKRIVIMELVNSSWA